MKKTIVLISALLILSACCPLFAFNCNAADNISKAVRTDFLSTPPEWMYPIDFVSYKEFNKIFSEPECEKSLALKDEKYIYTKEYRRFLDRMMSDDDILVPKLNNDVMKLQDREGFTNNISVFRSEHYNLPWIWYHCQYANDTRMIVSITYLSVVEGADIKDTDTMPEIIEKIYPGAPNIDNYDVSVYKRISEKEINLYDRKVSAVIYEYNNDVDQRIMIAFRYNDMCVHVKAFPTTLTEEFFEAFSIGKYSETSMNEVSDGVIEKPGTLLIDSSKDIPIYKPSPEGSTEKPKNGCSSSVGILPAGLTAAAAVGYAFGKKRRKE